jgi:hypothetical protein
MRWIFPIILFSIIFYPYKDSKAAIKLSPYGIDFISLDLKNVNDRKLDSLVQASLKLKEKKKVTFVSKHITHKKNTSDFYFLLLLTGIWGLFKSFNAKFFNDVWRAFINPTLGNRQIKDLIQSATMPNLIMNLLSTICIGVYLYYLFSFNVDWRFSKIPIGLAIGLFIIGTLLIYTGKFLMIQFAGWAFNIQSSTEQYNFNVYLVNKILGFVLLPFIICFAFLNPNWHIFLITTSIIVVILLFMYRYIRSWNIFSSFFQNSRFHFFMYLCTFELLPMAIILKLVLLVL